MNSNSNMMNKESSGTVIAGNWKPFSGFARSKAQQAPRRPKWFRSRTKGGNNQKEHEQQRSMLESTKRDSSSTIDLHQDEQDNLKIHAVRIASTRDESDHQDEDSLDHSSLSLAHGDLVDCCDKDGSFEDTEATETITSESEGTEEEDEDGSFLDCEEASIRSVRFADEAGLPMEHVFHIEQPAHEQLEAEVVVLCLSPQHKKFEFVHVGYHRCTENDDRSMGNKPTLVSDLLAHLPPFCTNDRFQNATFDKIFRTNKSNGMLEKLLGDSRTNGVDEPSIPLQDCSLDKSDILVATVTGCSDEETLSSVESLLSNSRLMKTMRRARRTQRGLKWIPAKYTDTESSSPANHMITRTSETVKDYLGLFLCDDDEIEVGEEEEHAKVEQDRFERELMQGVVMVTGLTVIFSMMGI